MSKTITHRSGAPISELIDPATREKLEDLQQRLGQQEALKRPRDADGRYSAVPRDQLVKDNKTLRRLGDITAAAGHMSVGSLLDAAQVPSVTQLTKRYSTQASRAPLLGLLAGRTLGPVQSAVLGTTPRFGHGAALVPNEPKPLATIVQTPAADDIIDAEFEVVQDSLRLEGPNTQQAKKPAGLWDSLKDFGRAVMGEASKAWNKLKNHRLVAPVLAFFVGKGFGPAHASMQGANPPKQPTPGAPMQALLPPPPDQPPAEAKPERTTPDRLTGPTMAQLPSPFVAPAQSLSQAVENLRGLWPAGVKTAPAPYLKQAEALQGHKAQALAKLPAMPEASEVSRLLNDSDQVNGRDGYSQIAGRLAQGFLGDSEVRSMLSGVEGSTPRSLHQVQAAAMWLGLADVDADVATLHSPRPTAGDASRGARGAALFERLGLGGAKTAALLAGLQDHQRQDLPSQLLRLIDHSAQVCSTADGIDAQQLETALQARAKAGAFEPELATLMAGAAQRGLLSAALS